MMAGMAGVTLENVWKIYRGDKGQEVSAVKDVCLEIEDKEFIVLVGPSGCGKSTTLRMVAGLEEISRGTVNIGDREVNHVPPAKRDIAMVFQNYALYPHMTVRENLAFSLKLKKISKAEVNERVEKAAEILGLSEYLHRRPAELSGGQSQRVAVGRAIVRNPAVFLFDEPLSNLDAKMRVQMRSELTKLHKQLDATMLYVTHDQVEAMTMGSRIVVMKDGVVRQFDEPLKIYREPADMFVAGFMGSPPMNFLTGEAEKGGVRLAEGEHIDAPIPDDVKEHADVVLGVRPEHVSITGEGILEGKVTLVEPMGGESYVHLEVQRCPFLVKVDGDTELPKIGETCGVNFEQEKVHLFDPHSGKRIAGVGIEPKKVASV